MKNIKKAALISVFDKTNIIDFSQSLMQMGYTILSTGGTYRFLIANNIKVQTVESYTKSPEFFDGRVKTLHPKIHAGILARRNDIKDSAQMKEHNIYSIDVIAVNLYPFEETITKSTSSFHEIIENIDIGGVTLLRAAAKNCQYVTTLCDALDYKAAIKTLEKANKKDLHAFNISCAAKAFAKTAHYDSMIARKLATMSQEEMENKEITCPRISWDEFSLGYKKIDTMRYGENPHQSAQLYELSGNNVKKSIIHAKQLHGKKMSFNNIRDAEAAVRIANNFKQACIVAIKHCNPCGVAIANVTDTPNDTTLLNIWNKCYKGDPISIFGGIIACNKEITPKLAKKMSQIFLEIIIAPKYNKEALSILKQKKNIRLLQLPFTPKDKTTLSNIHPHTLSVFGGGLLVQDYDNKNIQQKNLQCVTKKKVSAKQMEDLLFAWKVCQYVKSNCIVIVKNNALLGVGAGQMNRVGAAEIAIKHAIKHQGKASLKGAVMASDAFFPMPDTVTLAAKNGIAAVIQPGGSIKDKDSIKVCDTYKMAMLMTGTRHFLH